MSEREICMEGIEHIYAGEIFDAVFAARERGEVTLLTEDGKAVAAIVPVAGPSDVDAAHESADGDGVRRRAGR
jgi:antitoxin (DNA-binding transcriptional repressor) of toxin-antitoxin stability system